MPLGYVPALSIVSKSISLGFLCALSGCGTLPQGDNFRQLNLELSSINLSKAYEEGDIVVVPIDIALSNHSGDPLTFSLGQMTGAVLTARLEDKEDHTRWEFEGVPPGVFIQLRPTQIVTLLPNTKTNCSMVIFAADKKAIKLVNNRLIEGSDLRPVPKDCLYRVSWIAFSSGSGHERMCIVGIGETSIK
jgi:hypothetical protein